MTDFFELGRIVKPQGIKGEVKVEAYTDDLERFYNLDFVFFKEKSGYVAHTLERVRVDAKAAYLKFEDTDDRNTAEKLRGTYIYIDRANAAELPPGAHYIQDLIGMTVSDDEGKKLGVLKDILQTGSKDVYIVALESGGTLMFPSIEGVYISKDVERGEIVLDHVKLAEVAVYDV
ncbi:ribosome maturation factor RimM [Christensenellaceae bacterium OttesenSCG-928-K19]|nr:ribosome maturation factor RimM [Christensenellaceae bacterium OttesenSCG-928-K19]